MIRRLLNKIESIYYYRYFSKKSSGAYSFLLKKIYKSTDIDFIENIWKLDHFREILDPQELKLEKIKKVLVLAPHQDDEIIGCGGTLLKLKEQGSDISICFLTNGAELSNPIKSVVIRKEEAETVVKKLNSEVLELGIDNVSMEIEKKTLGKLTQILNNDWDTIFTIWPVDQPPKHRLCSYLVGKALAEVNFTGNLVFYAVHTDLIPNFYVDITKVIDDKEELLHLYKSQIDVQRYDHLSRGLDAWRSRFLGISNQKRFVELFLKIPVKAYQDFQNIFEKSDTRKLFKGNENCIKSFKKVKKIKNV